VVLATCALAMLAAPGDLPAQSAAAKSTTAAPADPGASKPLGRYIAKDNLVFYMEFDGLDSHASAWHNTAAFKMLTETPLGDMIQLVAGQLLDKGLEFVPNRRLSGSEIVTLAKSMSKFGWVVAMHTGSKPGEIGTTFVMRNAAIKEVKPFSSRLVGWMMGSEKPRIEHKDGGRNLVAVPFGKLAAGGDAATGSWAWWPEGNDVVICSSLSSVADRVIAALDGKAPSALDHPLVTTLKTAEGSFEPVCVAFVDTANSANLPAPVADLLKQAHEGQGIERIDMRWGFESEAILSITRLVTPKPWKSLVGVLDQKTFDKGSLMPMPDSVESFLELSISPSKLLEAIEQMGLGGELRAQIDELSESVRTAGSIDLKKDVLAHLGPRMVAYLGSGRSATANDDSLEAAFKNGWNLSAAVTAMQSYFPKLTLVAEVTNPEAFGKGLDTVMIAVNAELKAQAIEKEAEEKAAAEKANPGGAGRGAGAADRTKRRRSKEPSHPHFQAMLGQAKTQSTGGVSKSFALVTPSDSPIRFGPPSFRPTVMLEDKYVAFAVSAEGARAAIAAAKRKDWKPSGDLVQAIEKLPPGMVALDVTDVRESLSSLLSSLPGTLQTMINTSIALAKAKDAGAKAPGAPGAPPTAMAGMSRPQGAGAMMRRGGPRGAAVGGGGGAGPVNEGGPASPATGPRGPANPGAPGSTGTAATESMIVLKVEPEKLPKASDLKAHLFPSTWAITVADKEIRFVSRTAFPDISSLIGGAPVLSALPGTQAQLKALQAAPPAAATPGAGTTDAAATGQPASPDSSKDAPTSGRGPRRGRRPD
jgi:hypothetical protein